MVNIIMNKTENNKSKENLPKDNNVEDYLFPNETDNKAPQREVNFQPSDDFYSFSNGYNFMASRQNKEISVANTAQNNDLKAVDNDYFENEITDKSLESQDLQYDDTENYDAIEIYESDIKTKTYIQYLVPVFFITLALAWSGFFAYSHINLLHNTIEANAISALIIDWAIPIILIALGWMLFMRSSTAEAMKFGDISNGLHKQADNVQIKMREVNEDIALARDFLAQYSQDLEHIGRNAANNIINASEKIEIALSDSTEKAEKLERTSASTHKNLELLRKNLPVVNSAAKDATNMIGKAGIEAIDQIKSLKNIIEENTRATILNQNEINSLSQSNLALTQDMKLQSEEVKIFSDNIIAQSQEEIIKISATIKSQYENFSATIEDVNNNLEQKNQQITESLKANIEKLSAAMDDLSAQNSNEDAVIENMIAKIKHQITQSEDHINILNDKAVDQMAKMAFAMTALKENSDNVGQGLNENQKQAAILIEQSENILLALDSSSREMDETIPASVQRLEDMFTAISERFDTVFNNINSLAKFSDDISEKYNKVDEQVAASAQKIETLSHEQSNLLDGNTQKMQQILDGLNDSKSLIENIAETSDGSFLEQIKNVQSQIDDNIAYSRQSLNDMIEDSSQKIAENGSSILHENIEKQILAIENNLQSTLQSHIETANEAIGKLQTQLTVIEEMTENMEKRIAESADEFSTVGDESFSRQMALLTESLNSTAIDVAKIISNDVTDNAWAAYLKGDRGVFTRRAVKLLSANEAKLIISHYDENIEFRDHVNRYIHDFEAMMRVLLSTRDGNAIGVTILSSDVGKLYVALAQAIERLRD